MTLVLGQQDQSDCDPCNPCPCPCGPFCSNSPYCGRNMAWVVTPDGAAAAGSDCTCTDLNSAYPLETPASFFSYDAATFNSDFAAYYGWTNAKDGSTVCAWRLPASYDPSDPAVSSSCTDGALYSSAIFFPVVFVVLGSDDKWRMCHSCYFVDRDLTAFPSEYSCDLAGEALLGGSGAAVNCGTIGEGSPTFSLEIPLTKFNESGTPLECSPPTSVLVEGNPQ